MEQSRIKVSIIIPCFNDAKYIKETIDSVLSQTHKNIEIIVVDDFSTDGSPSIVNSFNDSRLIYVRNDKNMGAAYCRNQGIKKATGSYIAFLDGDDVWEKDKIEKQLRFMVNNDYSFSCTKYILIDESSKELGIVISAPKKITHNMFLRSDYIGCLTAMYKREVFPDLEIPNELKKRNDYALWIKLSEKCDCYYLDEPLARYRKRTKSLSSTKKHKLLKYHKQMFVIACGFSAFKASLYSLLNVFYFYLRRIKYSKKYQPK